MKNKTLFSLIFISLPMIGGCQTHTIPPLNKMAVRVVDETGEPVSNAYVRASTYWKPGTLRGLTDTNGFFRYEDRVYQEIGYGVYKKGYYDSRGEAWWPKKLFEVPETNLVVELKQIIEPVPLVYRKLWIYFPHVDRSLPFDLEVGDWVFPDGKGRFADIWVSGTNKWVSDLHFDHWASLVVSNHLDGFILYNVPKRFGHQLASELRPPQSSPEMGYTNKIDLCLGKHKLPTGTQWIDSRREDQIYVFRTRGITNEVGEIVSATVGWIESGGTVVDGTQDGKLGIALEYYYNPDPTSRSLEPKELADRQARDIPKDMK